MKKIRFCPYYWVFLTNPNRFLAMNQMWLGRGHEEARLRLRLRAAVSEVLRMHAPLFLLMRTVEQDVEFKARLTRGS